MSNEITEKVCKCCGQMKPITAYSLGNNRRPIGTCKECRKRQQVIANYKAIEVSKMTAAQADRYAEAVAYMDKCKQVTGFETGKYSSNVGVVPRVAATAGFSQCDLSALYKMAQQRRKNAEALGIVTPEPTAQLIRDSSLELIIECGYTQKECFNVLDTLITADDPQYDELWEKLILIPI